MTTPLRVTERHRRNQLTITARVLGLIIPWMPLIRRGYDREDLNASLSDWTGLVLPEILAGREQSQRRAYQYFREVKEAATGGLEIPVYDDIRTEPSDTQIETSLLVTGPGVYRDRLLQGDPEHLALRKAQTAVSGATTRHVLEGSRKLIQEAARADQTARGWIRVTDGDPCAFCAMLATRGFAVLRDEDGFYTSRESALFVQDGNRGTRQPGERYHDQCGCTAMPVFGTNFTMPPDAEKWERLYAESTKGVSGADKLKAFRKAFNEARKNESSRKANDG